MKRPIRNKNESVAGAELSLANDRLEISHIECSLGIIFAMA